MVTKRKIRVEAVALIVVTAVVIAAVLVVALTPSHSPHRALTPGHAARRPQRSAPAWPAPALHNPQVIRLTSANANLTLNLHRDYVLELPRGHALVAPRGLSIWGGHNVVLVGGTVYVPDRSGAATFQAQTGTIHVEGVRFSGPQLMEGLDLSEPRGATVELENIYIDTVHGGFKTNHADLIQTWAGPRRLLIDGLMGSTQYQGFFLLPNQWYPGPAPQLFDLRNVYINDSQGSYALWVADQHGPFPLRVSNVTVTPNPARSWRGWWLWPKPSTGDATWNQVSSIRAAPPAVRQQIQSAGLHYHR
jgi:hypothetical protein